MAFRSLSVTITTTPTLLVDAQAGDLEFWVNIDPNSDYYIGGDDVTTMNGLHLFGRNPFFGAHVRPGDQLWAVVASGTADANVLIRSA